MFMSGNITELIPAVDGDLAAAVAWESGAAFLVAVRCSFFREVGDKQ